MNTTTSKFSAREAGYFCWSEQSRTGKLARGSSHAVFKRAGETFTRNLNCAALDFLAVTATQEPRTRLFEL